MNTVLCSPSQPGSVHLSTLVSVTLTQCGLSPHWCGSPVLKLPLKYYVNLKTNSFYMNLSSTNLQSLKSGNSSDKTEWEFHQTLLEDALKTWARDETNSNSTTKSKFDLKLTHCTYTATQKFFGKTTHLSYSLWMHV